MVKRLSKLRSADEAFRELPGQLFHLSQRRQLGHFFAAHPKELQQDAFLFCEARLKDLAAGDGVRELPELCRYHDYRVWP